eukprot:6015764-Pyramimonas_sp.AAC.1
MYTMWCELGGASYVCQRCGALYEAATGGNVAKPRWSHPAHEAAMRGPRAATWQNLAEPVQFLNSAIY